MTSILSALAALQEYSLTTQSGERITADALGPAFSWGSLGVMRWPIAFCAVMVVVLAVRAALRMRSGEPEQSVLARETIDGSLFWGAYAALLGILGTVFGFTLAAQAVEAVGRVETSLVWGGVKVALGTTIFGLMVFLVAALVWFGLRQWHRKTVMGGV